MPKQTIYLSDYRASEDGLNFGVYKPALLNILENAETPLTLGVFGTWGSGKTTLLNMLMNDIQKKGLPSLRTIWFTAWKYEQQDALWRAFMLRVVDGLHPRKDDGTRCMADELSDKNQKQGALHLERLERSIYETVNWQDEGKWSMDVGALAKEGVRLPIWLAFHLAGLGTVAKDLGLNPQLTQVLEREVREHHLNQLGSMEQFAAEFEKAVRLILGEEGRLIVLVDDLDRCLPEKAVEVLEAIKLFLDVPGTVFILGMDREVIRRGIETHYGALLGGDGDKEEIPINGDVYLQKMIQIPFNLPPLDARGREGFIEKLEESLPHDFRLEDITRQVFARGLYPNPRQVKRALNVFYLLKQVAEEQERQKLIEPDVLAWPLLAKTVLIQSQWPELYKLWRQYPTLIQTLEAEYTRQPILEDELLHGQKMEETSEEGKMVKAGQESQRRRSERPQATGLLAPFLNNRQKYALLADLLLYPEETGQGRLRARFNGLTRNGVQIYVGLVGAVEQATEAIIAPMAADLLVELESGDPARIREALAAVNEREPKADGPNHVAFRDRLVIISQNPELAPVSRAASADIADELGCLPKDLHSLVPVPAENAQFYISRYPVTNFQYARFLTAPDFAEKELWLNFPKFDENAESMRETWGDGGWKFLRENLKEGKVLMPRYWDDAKFGESRPGAPVVGISWWEANAYCKWLLRHWSDLEEGRQGISKPEIIRLPLESEWVLAAGGESGNRHAWGVLKNKEAITRFANTSESGIGRTTPVWMYPQGASSPDGKSLQGLMDMSGNVWEWQANYYGKEHNTLGLRGGSWLNDDDGARVSVRNFNHPGSRVNDIGFRVAASLPSG
jgi:formylglycine-generating enzyme required for sulfatase activity